MTNTIKHRGIVENSCGTHLKVRIVQTSACATCSIKGHCTSSDTKEKLIDVIDTNAGSYCPGDAVWVVGTLSMGARAVLWAFIVPFLLVVVVLFAAMYATGDELSSALLALCTLAPYYYILWLKRKTMRRKFSFTVERMEP